MSTTSAAAAPATAPETPTDTSRGPVRAFAIVIGLTAVVIALQGLWAGIFLEHDGGRDAAGSWVDVHSRAGDLAILLAAVATVVAFARLRHRRDLWLGSAALTVLLVLEAYLGGLIVDAGKDTLTAVHVPMAMGLMALAVWLPLRIRRPSPAP